MRGRQIGGRGRFGGPRGGSPARRGGPPASKLYHLDFSDSSSSNSYSGDDDDIPNIVTSHNTANNKDKISSMANQNDQTDSEDEIPNIQTRPSVINRSGQQGISTMITKKQVNLSSKAPVISTEQQDDNEYSYSDYQSDESRPVVNQKTKQQSPRQNTQHNIVIPVKADNAIANEAENQNQNRSSPKTFKTSNELPPPEANQVQTEQQQQQNEASNPQHPTEQGGIPPPPSQQFAGVPLYQVGWKNGVMKKSHIRFTLEGRCVYFAKKIKKSYIISRNQNFDKFSEDYVASLKISKLGSRYTLLMPAGEEHGKEEAEIMGFAFYDEKQLKKLNCRAFRFAIPKEKVTPYFPATKQMNLSRIAEKNITSDDIFIYHSKFPKKDGNKISLNFGKEYSIISSTKNFMVEDENQKLLFMIFKSSQGLCSIKFIEPLNPLLAFALSIGIITKTN